VLGVLAAPAVRGAERAYDVVHYDATVEVDAERASVRGHVHVWFVAEPGAALVLALDAGELEVEAVREEGAGALAFEKAGSRLSVALPASPRRERSVEVRYHGSPRRGIAFVKESGQVATAFATSQWLPCVDAPDERATLELALVASRGSVVVATGERRVEQRLGDRVETRFWLAEPAPSYLYGFALGTFREVRASVGAVELRYLAPRSFTARDLERIFGDTPDMLSFFAAKAGVEYPHKSYTQVLLEGGSGQEMAGFAVMGTRYGERALEDPADVWLGAHELAHQWWGNGVTNESWRHFWLNEGVATFMAAAYLEHRFGRAAYTAQIDAARAKYERLRGAGKDHALVYDDWTSPSADDRAIVYDKGAYVVHLLREELGEDAFWAGLFAYTQANWGSSVTTRDFEAAMERASGRDLDEFFARWVY
jgi:aminopeptidase N